MNTMGEMISKLRKEKGMTQSDLAKLMNVSDKAVSKWERNQSCPDIHSLPQLAKILDTSVEDLLNASEKEESKKENIMDTVLTCVPLALAVALIVTSMMKTIDLYSAFSMCGIALFCLSLKELKK